MLKFNSILSSAAALLAFAAPMPISAQQPPSQAEAQRILQTRPEVAAAVRARIGTSGLSPEQIRARLRAAGYSENLLDAYMPGSADTLRRGSQDDVLRAVRFLGLVDAQEQDSLARLRAGMDGIIFAEDTVTRMRDTLPSSRVYGLDIFRRSTSQFEPDLAGPVDQTYKLGPRDVLAVILTGGVENSYSLEVTREGFVVIPQVGQIYVANLTLDQATDLLYRRLQRVYSGLGRGAEASTKLFVTVARLRANQVFVIGDVVNPGSYQVSSAGTMLTALYASGGPTENGNLRNIQLRRANRVVSSLDLYRYLVLGDAASDVRLETGDVIFVPVHGPRVEITGEVIRPAIYEMAPGETLNNLITLAGGFKASASRDRVLVRRIVPPEQRTEAGRDRTVMDVTSNQAANMPLVEGDQVEVFPIAERVRNRIAVIGAVWTPGNQGYTPGMRLSDALRLAGGVRPDVKGVQISRLQFDQTRRELRAQFADTTGRLVQDMALQEDDSITVFATSDFRPDRYVVITGAVRNGGRFPYHEGMTLRDLLHYAGGLADGALLDRAELARVPADRRQGTLAITTEVPLDSTYLLERGLDGKYVGPAGLPTSANGAPELALEPYDNILILHQPNWQIERSVVLTGEVMFPGRYVLKSKDERVADVIARAGGLTRVAYPAGAVFTRTEGRIGRIGFDLDRVMRETSYRDNIVMQAGDSLFVPPTRHVVDVRGAVHSPIAVAYRPGADIMYYINAAGGATFDADRNRAYVQQPNGVVEPYKKRALLIPDSKPEPLAGAVVVVPVEDPSERKDWAGIVGSVAQVLASVIAIVVVATR